MLVESGLVLQLVQDGQFSIVRVLLVARLASESEAVQCWAGAALFPGIVAFHCVGQVLASYWASGGAGLVLK